MSDQLPANPMADFATRAATHRQPASRVEGGFLRFNGKTGQWCIGVEETPVDGEEVMVFSPAMMHGYMRWGEIPPAKAFVSVAQPYPEKPEPIDGVDYDGKDCTFYAKEARQMSGRFLADDLDNFIFNTDSMGGVERMDQLFDDIIKKAGDGTPYCYPVVVLESDWYKRSTGKVYKPVFTIAHWCDVDGVQEGKVADKIEAPAEEEEEAPPAARTRRRKRVA